MSISIKPLEDRIVVQTVEAEQTTAPGLVIPDTAKEKPQEGKVVAVGPGRVDDSGKRVPVDVTEGDLVIYSKYGGTEVNYAGEDYLILSARDVLAVVTKRVELTDAARPPCSPVRCGTTGSVVPHRTGGRSRTGAAGRAGGVPLPHRRTSGAGIRRGSGGSRRPASLARSPGG